MDSAVSVLEGLEDHLVRPKEQVAADLERFANLLRKWQPAQNLVSRETLPMLWHRHMRDSLQLLIHLTGGESQFFDVGAGGGFPALPLAIVLKNGRRHFNLIEGNQRKCAFLRTVARDLDLPVNVQSVRIESLELQDLPQPDLITCRATAPLKTLLGWLAPLTGPETRLLLHKGREHGEEWMEAAAGFDADVLVLPSLTDEAGVILDIRHLRRR